MMMEPLQDFETDGGGGLGGGGGGVNGMTSGDESLQNDEEIAAHEQRHRRNQRNNQYRGYQNQQDEDPSQPHYMTGSRRGKPSSFYINGDQHFEAKKIVLNPKYFRDMTHYLDHLTDKLQPKFGAIRKIHTPNTGSRVAKIDELQPGESYVAAGGEKFRAIGYDQIAPSIKRRSEPFKYDADPVVHSRLFQSSGRIKKIENQSIIIKVWPNGGEKKVRRPRVVLLRRTPGFNMTHVILLVNDMLKEDCNGPVEAIFSRQGSKLTDVESLEHNGVYVALTKRDRFKRALYSDFATRDLHVSPRPDRKTLDPLFSRSNNSTSHSSPEHSNASSSQSHTNGHSRRRQLKREEDQVFPAKPVKHQRNDRAKKVDLDKDEGGVFKAKGNNSNTRGAREVNDSRHTKVDLPIDQQKAKVVQEETPTKTKDDRNRPPHSNPRGGNTEFKSNSQRQPPPAASNAKINKRRDDRDNDEFIRDIKARREQSAVKIQAGFRGYKTRKQMAKNKPPPSNRQQTPKTSKVSPPPRGVSQQSESPVPMSTARERTPSPLASLGPRSSTRERTMSPAQQNPSPPPAYDFAEEEKAATKIQAGFRGHVSRKNTQAQAQAQKEQEELERYQALAKAETEKAATNASEMLLDEEDKAASKIQAGFRGYQARKEYEAKKVMAETQSRNNQEDQAAIKIQANFRGYKARSSLKEQNKERQQTPQQAPPAKPAAPPSYADDEEEDEDDVYDKAATKIQAGFRGYKVRRGLNI